MKRADVKKLIIKTISESKKPLTINQVSEKLNRNYAQMFYMIEELMESGEIYGLQVGKAWLLAKSRKHLKQMV